jgi:hypothetical protein
MDATPVAIPLGANAQQILDAHPPGTRFVLASGIHRAQALRPQDGDVIEGEPGAVLNGCLPLENWERHPDGWWTHTAPFMAPMAPPGTWDCASPLCAQTQDFYLDGVRLMPVETLAMVTTDGEWFFDRTETKIYLKADPTDLPAELGGPAITAIDCSPPGLPPALGVVIKNLTIENYPCPPQVGAVRLGGGGTIRDCRVTGSHSYGIQLMWGPALVKDCYIADNGMCGIGGTGIGAIVEGCEIADNVWPLYAGLAWDNGGVKMAVARDMVFRRNYIHRNGGPGLWVDIQTTNLTVEDNIVEFNDWEGILIEISDKTEIRRNISRWNGLLHRGALWGGQVCLQNSSGVVIESNYLESGWDGVSPWGSRQGVMLINQVDRQFEEGLLGARFGVRDVHISRNTLVMPGGGHNGVDYGTLGWDSYEDFLAANLTWADNRYLVAQPLYHLWSWRLQPNWDATVAKWLRWEQWSPLQDSGSTLESFGPHDYPPYGTGQHALIKATTGHDYPALKAELTRRPAPPATDRDADGLPDAWERLYATTLNILDGPGDNDGDGATNLQEAAAGTNPLDADSDGDGLSDSWESSRGLNPLIYDSHLDADDDGRSTLEEMADGTDPATAEPLDLPAPESALSFWVSTTSHLTTGEEGALTRWVDSSRARLPISWFGGPRVSTTTPTGVPLVDPGDMVLVPGAEGRWGTTESGFTMTFIYQPEVINTDRAWGAVLTNEEYLMAGFRVRLESGYLVASASQSGGTLILTGHTRLTAGQPHIITLAVGPNGTGGALYLDGQLEAWSPTGHVIPSEADLMLGNTNGVTPHPGLFGDIILFNRLLTHRERRSLERWLQQKFVAGLPVSDDRDRDGLPDDWEIARGVDPRTPNREADDDGDGATNQTEFQLGLNPVVADTDGDTMPDGWEVRWGTDPLVDDRLADPDGDGLSNQDEYVNGSSPLQPDGNPPFLAFNRMRLWWRATLGAETSGAFITRWLDSAPAGNAGQPQVAGIALPLAPTLWAERPVLRLSEYPMVSSRPVDPGTLLHREGATITLVIRPESVPTDPGFKRIFAFGDVLVGLDTGLLILRNASGSRAVASAELAPATPFILTCLYSPDPASSRLLVNGQPVAELSGFIAPSPATFSLGGPGTWPVDVAEVIVHAGLLTPLSRRFAEDVLQAKWLGDGPLAADTDSDGLPDWWEHESCSIPAVADSAADADWDGLSNQAAYAAGRPGFVWLDADGDSMHDHWESAFGLNPAVDDATEDVDHDGIPNALEHALLSSPIALESPEPWGISVGDSAAGSPAVLTVRVSSRSWASRGRWQTNPTLQPAAWEWILPGSIAQPTTGATAVEQLLQPPPKIDGAPRFLVRLALFGE